MSFKNKVVIITGASSGIGAGAALKFVQEGAKVAIVGRQKDKLHQVAEECKTLGYAPLIIEADVTKDEDLKRIVNSTIERFGKLDVLVNNAGCLSLDGILTKNAIESFDKIIATNLRSAVYLTHLAAPYLIKTKGNIINISSIVAKQLVLENSFAYNTSKAALDHFTRSVALELGPAGVRVNTVNPGLVRTDIAKNMDMDKSMEDALWARFEKSAPLRKIAATEEVADLIAFIASDKAKSITGSSFVVDNGELLVPSSGQNNS